ncbi:hypothetical protein CASFOL_040724 [Castilleja foliolosa]|uniref:Uncharacterized protein n=1 Tax=Castilleja foliolosa TaxID=1961234 RepID=A0ABD3BCY5_9LAMI
MGCCVSTNTIPNSKSSGKRNCTDQSPTATCPLPEKESIKEVLYETTTQKKSLHKNNDAKIHRQDDAVYTAKTPPAVGKSTGRGPGSFPGRNRPGLGNERIKCGGESSGRRSKSQVARTNTGLGGGQSSRKMTKSRDRVKYGSDEMIRKMDAEVREFTCTSATPTTKELLENTHVSLECFIFL